MHFQAYSHNFKLYLNYILGCGNHRYGFFFPLRVCCNLNFKEPVNDRGEVNLNACKYILKITLKKIKLKISLIIYTYKKTTDEEGSLLGAQCSADHLCLFLITEDFLNQWPIYIFRRSSSIPCVLSSLFNVSPSVV